MCLSVCLNDSDGSLLSVIMSHVGGGGERPHGGGGGTDKKAGRVEGWGQEQDMPDMTCRTYSQTDG